MVELKERISDSEKNEMDGDFDSQHCLSESSGMIADTSPPHTHMQTHTHTHTHTLMLEIHLEKINQSVCCWEF